MELRELSDRRLGFGYLRLPHLDPNNSADVDLAEVRRMVDLFLERGFAYFDTAYTYLNYKSELFIRDTLTRRYPRDAFFLTTKLPCSILKAGDSPRRFFDEQLEKCGVDYFDAYLLHGIDAAREGIIEQLDCFGFLQELKRAGKVRLTGFSFHDSAQVLDRFLTRHPEVDVVQIQLNYLDWDHAVIQSGACYEVCRRHQKPMLIMEPVKGGTLARLPEPAERLQRAYAPESSPACWALRFAAGQPGVAMVLSGMSNLQQMRENTELMQAPRPLGEPERTILRQVSDILKQAVTVPCTGCAYCVEGCPAHIPLPRYFALYNEFKRNGWQSNAKARYTEMLAANGRASACIGCRRCEAQCPQHLEAAAWIAQVAKAFEG